MNVDAFLASLKHPRAAEIHAVRKLILESGPDVGEEIKWNAPSFFTTEHFATFHLRAKTGIQVVLHLGARKRDAAELRASIKDPHELLEWKSPDRAIATFRDLAQVKKVGKSFTAILRVWVKFLPAR